MVQFWWCANSPASWLQALNQYVDELSRGRTPKPTRLEFFVRDGPSQLRKVVSQLGASGSLAPLLYAFGLITVEELKQMDTVNTASDVDFLAWLRDQVQDAMLTAEKHDALKWHIRRLRNALEEKYQLAGVQVGLHDSSGPACLRTAAYLLGMWP